MCEKDDVVIEEMEPDKEEDKTKALIKDALFIAIMRDSGAMDNVQWSTWDD
jgi:hypothetical protein